MAMYRQHRVLTSLLAAGFSLLACDHYYTPCGLGTADSAVPHSEVLHITVSIPIGIGNGSFLTSRLGLIHRLGVYCFETSKLVLQLVGWSLVDGFTAHVVDYGVGAVH